MNLPAQAALARYGAVKVTTASPGQILVMLYDGLLRFLREAQAAFLAKERARGGERISRSLAILDQLLVGLDPKHAPDLCERLQSLYIFCIQRLVRANLEQNPEMVGEVVRVLSPLRDAWSTAVLEVASAPR
jgi:flagellar secretion chaperone FliS